MNKYINTSIIKAIVIRHIFEWRRNLDRIVDSFWWPIIDMIAWGLVSSYIQRNNPQLPYIVSFFVGGAIFWTFVQNAQRDINMPFLSEAWNRNLINLFTTPIRLREFIIGTIVLGFIKLSLTVIVLSILAFFLYHYNIFILGWFLIPAIINLILLGWWVGFFVNGCIFKFGYRVQPFAWAIIFVLYPFSAILYPVSTLPDWAQKISLIVPTSYVFESMRSVIFSKTFSPSTLIISFSLNIFYISLSILFLRAMFENAKRNAQISRLN